MNASTRVANETKGEQILLTREQAAQLLGISLSYLKTLMQKGQIPTRRIATRCVRLHIDDVRRWADEVGME